MIRISKAQNPIHTEICLPLSKSMSNRLLVMRFLQGKEYDVIHVSDADDTKVLKSLLNEIKKSTNKHKGVSTLHAGNAGTVFRFLTAVLAITEGKWILSGTERMLQRPVGALVDALTLLGCSISYQATQGFPPLYIEGCNALKHKIIEIDASISSQFVSALLMIAPLIKDGLTLKLTESIVSEPYIRLTVNMMQQEGATITQQDNVIRVAEYYQQHEVLSNFIEADWSAAAFWYTIVALNPDSKIVLQGLSKVSCQGDALLADIFKHFGVSTVFEGDNIIICNTGNCVSDFSFDFTAYPDIVQAVAVTCAAKNIHSQLRGLKSLRIKETDRIQALENELNKFGFLVNCENDNLHIHSSFTNLNGKTMKVNTYNDHRMAMSFAPLVSCGCDIIIEDQNVVDKSYPMFWKHFKKAGFGQVDVKL